MRNIAFNKTRITGGFWNEKQKLVREVTTKAVYDRFAETYRFAALKCDLEQKEFKPHIFWDSDVAKWLEGVAYLLMEKDEPQLRALAEEAIDDIVKNTAEDGYFNSAYVTGLYGERFTNRGHHELYCLGHLIEGAIAWKRATQDGRFLDAMCRYTDLVERIFKIEKSAAFVTPGHPELELALVKLYEETKVKRYLDLAKYFIDEHGKKADGKTYEDGYGLYNQDEMQIKDRSTAEGHAVRAMYLMAGAVDVARLTDDAELIEASKRVFDNVSTKRMYVTGGIGQTRIGEAFSIDYHLPNREAYTETCAAISLAMFAQRMQKTVVDSKYADVVERVIYNGSIAGLSIDGRGFFYENPLCIDPRFNNVNPSTGNKIVYAITQRKEVFNCSCCPPNITRFVPSIAEYIYTVSDDTLYVQQYMDSTTDDGDISISQSTNYPQDGEIRITVSAPQKYLALRIPSWCKSFSVSAPYEMKSGYATVALDGETTVTLKLDMTPKFVRSNRAVHENAGRVALTRGPIVYCLEGVDNGEDILSIEVDISKAPRETKGDFFFPNLLCDGRRPAASEDLYESSFEYEEKELCYIPYYAFANRSETEMAVWILKK